MTIPAIQATYVTFLDAVQAHLAEAVQRYRVTAPVVSRWADDLYIRINEDRPSVTLEELFTAQRLRLPDDDPRGWMDAEYAANYVTKLLLAQGTNTTGLLYH